MHGDKQGWWQKIIALVNALAKLHNFCIIEQDCVLDIVFSTDHDHLISNKGGYIRMVSNGMHNIPVPEGIMDCGYHFEDVPHAYWRAWNYSHSEGQLPQKIMHNKVVSMHYCCPNMIIK